MSSILAWLAQVVVVDDHGSVRFSYLQLIYQQPTLQVCEMAQRPVHA